MANPNHPTPKIKFDALVPSEMAAKAESTGVKKATSDALQLFILAILAGAFVGLGAIYYTTVLAGTGSLPYGVQRLLGGLVFCLGLVLVIVGGAELFTGNNLIIMAWANKKISTTQLLRNWGIVYVGNFVGSVLTALIMYFTRQYTFGNGAVGLTALNIANTKSSLEFIPAVALGIMCNALVCMAVWLCFSAHSTTDKILSIIFPISGFVAAGFEHSVANMYFIPVGLFIKQFDPTVFQLPAFVDAGKTLADYGALTWGNFFLKNLLPVTIGNVIGGALMVGGVYWFIYLRKAK
ncbi:MAG TPA: formate transporter FocA [Anaerolineae bacterium]|nr:formate transporter FocA [Anaerolineae bacterium]